MIGCFLPKKMRLKVVAILLVIIRDTPMMIERGSSLYLHIYCHMYVQS